MTYPDTKPILIFTWGNPSRGDDALGPAMFDLLEPQLPHGVEVLTDFQLQIEHAIDLEGRERVLFVDASTSAIAPFEIHPLKPERDASYTTHAMSPESLLSVYRQVNASEPPPAWMLSIRGYEFGLGLPMSAQARQNLDAAYAHILSLLNHEESVEWPAP
jgi:hydrogenase maturation protease